MANVLIIVLFNLCEIIECLRKRCFCQVTNGLHVSRQLSPDDNCLSSPASGLPLLYLCSLVQHCDNFHQTRARRPTAGHCCTVNSNYALIFCSKSLFFHPCHCKISPHDGKDLRTPATTSHCTLNLSLGHSCHPLQARPEPEGRKLHTLFPWNPECSACNL